MKPFISILLGFVLAANPLFGAVSQETEKIQIQESLTLRTAQETEDGRMIGVPVGILPKGSIVDIPKEYIERRADGTLLLDLTIQNWFQNAGKHFETEEDGVSLFYTPVKVIHPPMPHLSETTVYVGLEDLRLKERGSTLMNVIRPSQMISIINENNAETEIGSICTEGCIENKIGNEGQAIIEAQKKIEEMAINLTKTGSVKNNINRRSSSLNRKLENTCGISQAELCSALSQVIDDNPQIQLSLQEYVALVVQESIGGECKAKSGSNDSGLFQISAENLCKPLCEPTYIKNGKRHECTHYTSSCKPTVKRCTSAEFQSKLEKAQQADNGLEFWKSQKIPQCIFNPHLSLQHSIRVLKDAYNTIKGLQRRYDIDLDRDTFAKLQLSCYNGGHLYAGQAVRDLLSYNDIMLKKLSDEGVDLSIADRDVLAIKEDLERYDNAIASSIRDRESTDSQISALRDQRQQQSQQIDSQISSLRDQQRQFDQQIDSQRSSLRDQQRQLDQQNESQISSLRDQQRQFGQQIDSQRSSLRDQLGQYDQQIQEKRENSELGQTVAQYQAQYQQIIDTMEKLPETFAENLRKAEERRSAIKQQIESETTAEKEKLQDLVQRWNGLNQQEMSAIQVQQSFLSTLDNHLANVRDHKSTAYGLGSQYMELELREQALTRLISEIEEERWPYYLDQLNTQATNRTIDPARTTSRTQTEQQTTSRTQTAENTQQVEPDANQTTAPRRRRTPSRGLRDRMDSVVSATRRDYRFFRKRAGQMLQTASEFIEQFNPSQQDLYGIQALEEELDSLYAKKTKKNSKTTVDHNQINSEIQRVTEQLQEKRNKRSEDIARILDHEHRKSLSGDELAHAQRIIEDQLEEFHFGLGRPPGEDSFVSNVISFFSPHSREIEKLNRVHARLAYYIEEEKREQNQQAREEKDRRYLEDFRSRVSSARRDQERARRDREQRNRQQTQREQEQTERERRQREVAEDRQRMLELADKEKVQMNYLRSILTPATLQRLNRWKTTRASIDRRRSELEENELFKKMRPYLSEQKGSANLSVGARVTQAFNRQSLERQTQALSDLRHSIPNFTDTRASLAINTHADLPQIIAETIKKLEEEEIQPLISKKEQAEKEAEGNIQQLTSSREQVERAIAESIQQLTATKEQVARAVEESIQQLNVAKEQAEREAEGNIQQLTSSKEQAEREIMSFRKARVEASEQRVHLENAKRNTEMQLEAKQRDPSNWEDLKFFFYGVFLKEELLKLGIPYEIETKRKGWVASNLGYAEGIVDAAKTRQGENICSGTR